VVIPATTLRGLVWFMKIDSRILSVICGGKPHYKFLLLEEKAMERTVSYFITVSNGIVTGIHGGDINADYFGTVYYGHDRVVVPDDAKISVLDHVRFYDENWARKPDLQLIDEGLLPMPEGYVREGDGLRPMTQAERVIAGTDALPPGYKIENGGLVPMTQEELLEAGQITREEINQLLADKNTAELESRLAELLTPLVLARAEVDEEYAAERKAKIIALLAVKNQPGWPATVEWQEL